MSLLIYLNQKKSQIEVGVEISIAWDVMLDGQLQSQTIVTATNLGRPVIILKGKSGVY